MVRRPLERSPKSFRSTSSKWMAPLAWSLAAASPVAFASPALAQARMIDLPSGSLPDSIRRLSDLTGVSVGFIGRLPAITTRNVSGASSPTEALHKMLKGSGYRAIATGPSSFRVERELPGGPGPPTPSRRPSADEPHSAIIVTALKRPARLSTVPATEHVVGNNRLHPATGVAGSEALEREIPALTISGLGPGRNRLFLRGIGDGPLNGFNQGSVAILLDEARLNYDAPDPDWALVDVDQVEVLEGPQGPLYGTGALGGIVKVSTNRPDLVNATAGASAGLSRTQDGGPSNSQSLTLNVPLVPAKLAIRAVAYRERQGGWIDNAGGTRDSNRERLAGGRIALRWIPAGRWTLDLTGAIQNRSARDSQYVDGKLGPLERPNRVRARRHGGPVVQKAALSYQAESVGAERPRGRPVADRPLAGRLREVIERLVHQGRHVLGERGTGQNQHQQNRIGGSHGRVSKRSVELSTATNAHLAGRRRRWQ